MLTPKTENHFIKSQTDEQTLCSQIHTQGVSSKHTKHTGRITPDDVNVWNVLVLGRNQMEVFERSWADGFDNTLSKQVVTQARKKKGQQKEKLSIDLEAIYAQALGLLLSDRNFPFGDIIAYELGDFPPAYFREDGLQQQSHHRRRPQARQLVSTWKPHSRHHRRLSLHMDCEMVFKRDSCRHSPRNQKDVGRNATDQ